MASKLNKKPLLVKKREITMRDIFKPVEIAEQIKDVDLSPQSTNIVINTSKKQLNAMESHKTALRVASNTSIQEIEEIDSPDRGSSQAMLMKRQYSTLMSIHKQK